MPFGKFNILLIDNKGDVNHLLSYSLFNLVCPVWKSALLKQIYIFFLGEAEYVNDKPSLPGELYGALVLANKSNAVILNIDATAALVSI